MWLFLYAKQFVRMGQLWRVWRSSPQVGCPAPLRAHYSLYQTRSESSSSASCLSQLQLEVLIALEMVLLLFLGEEGVAVVVQWGERLQSLNVLMVRFYGARA